MSKRYRGYRRLTRTYPKQKWQLNVVNCNVEWNSSTLTSGRFYAKHSLICQTPVPLNSAASAYVAGNNIVKTGNFKVKGTFDYPQDTGGAGMLAVVYVIFVPQGISPDNTDVSVDNLGTSAFYSHPEWVLGWTRLNLNGQGTDNFSISSRLKRNLNSGDSIQLGVLLINNNSGSGSASYTARFRSTVQYAARAN